MKKFADSQVEDYSRWLREHKKDRSVLSLRDWLKEEVRIRVEAVEMAHGIEAEAAGNGGKHGDKGGRVRNFFSEGGNFSKETAVPTSKPPCVYCGENHGVWSCRRFQNLGVNERWNIAKVKRLCFRCLASDHEGRACAKARPCNINGCKRNHHHLLHGFAHGDTKDGRVVSPRGGGGGASTHTHTSTSKQETATEAFSLRTVPVWLKVNDRKVKVNAMLDDGSNETFLNEEVAGVLGLKERYQTVTVNVLNNEVETFQSMPLNVSIESLDGEFSKDIKVKTCPKRVTGNYKVENWKQSKNRWTHLTKCDFAEPAEDGLVDLLIGVDNAELHYSRADVRGEEGNPIARLGPLGWTCIGSPEGKQWTGARAHVSRTLFTREPNVNVDGVCCDIDRTLKRFWEIENCGIERHDTVIITEEENEVLKKLKESIRYTGNGYQVGVPWKDEKPLLPDNHYTALSRLRNTENKLKKDCTLGTEYSEIIKGYVEKGYLRRVEPDEPSPPEVWYLPYFPVIRMDKTTTKVRIVFDCSAKTDGVSLNDAICAGPKLQKDLFDVLIRFRRNPVALAFDIKEMYLQVEIEERDRPYFRMLWRDLDSSREPEVYEFSRVVFGKNSAPMEAQFVAQENARRHQDVYPMAAETVLKSTYMDVRSRPASLPEMKTSNRKKKVEDVPNVLTCRLQSPFNQEGKGETEPESEDWKLKPTRFSSWTRLVRLHARVWRVIFNMCNPNDSVKGQELSPEEIEDAEEEIISRTQLEAFPEEYMALLKEKEIPKKSSLRKLCPWLDDQGVMRCGGRLQFAECLPFAVRFPIILPRGICGSSFPVILRNNINISRSHAFFLMKFHRLVLDYPKLLQCELPLNFFQKNFSSIQTICEKDREIWRD